MLFRNPTTRDLITLVPAVWRRMSWKEIAVPLIEISTDESAMCAPNAYYDSLIERSAKIERAIISHATTRHVTSSIIIIVNVTKYCYIPTPSKAFYQSEIRATYVYDLCRDINIAIAESKTTLRHVLHILYGMHVTRSSIGISMLSGHTVESRALSR